MIPHAYLEAALEVWSENDEETVCPLAGNCMAPLLREGDSLLIRHGNQDIHVGDVVVFGSPGKINVNRVLRIENGDGRNMFLLKSDQGAGFQEPVPRGRILGKVVEVRGSNGSIRLDRLPWRTLNRILSIRSYIACRRRQADSPLWKAVNVLFALRSKIFPENFSITLIPLRAMCLANRICCHVRPYGRDRKAEG